MDQAGENTEHSLHQSSSSQNAPETPRPKEIKIADSDITLVFGQGPVQEADAPATLGRKGLNFFSRLEAEAAAQLLKSGKTKKVILSGGETGARAGQPDAAAEADLMADIIRRRLTTLGKDGSFYVANGHHIPVNRDGHPRPQSELAQDLQKAYEDVVLVENTSKDTIENFTNIVNEHLDNDPASKAKTMTLLGIGFHAHDTYSTAGVGRLEVLRNVFQLKGAQVVSAEDVLTTLVVDKKNAESAVGKMLGKLATLATQHEVAQQKSRQEKLLVEGLLRGAWKSAADHIRNPDRLRAMIKNNEFVRAKIAQSDDDLDRMDSTELRSVLQAADLPGTDEDEYARVKADVFKELEDMGTDENTGKNYFQLYGKGTDPRAKPNAS